MSYEVSLPYIYDTNRACVLRAHEGGLEEVACLPPSTHAGFPTVSVNYDTGHVAWHSVGWETIFQLYDGKIEEYDAPQYHCGIFAGPQLSGWGYTTPFRDKPTLWGKESKEIDVSWIETSGLFVVRGGWTVVSVIIKQDRRLAHLCVDGTVRAWDGEVIVSPSASVPQASAYTRGYRSVRVVDINGQTVGGMRWNYPSEAHRCIAAAEKDIAAAATTFGRSDSILGLYVFRREGRYARPSWAMGMKTNLLPEQIHIDGEYIYFLCGGFANKKEIHVIHLEGGYLCSLVLPHLLSPERMVYAELHQSGLLCGAMREGALPADPTSDATGVAFSVVPQEVVGKNKWLPAVKFLWQDGHQNNRQDGEGTYHEPDTDGSASVAL